MSSSDQRVCVCVFQGWICVFSGVVPHAEPGLQQEHGEGLGERLHRFIHHIHRVQWCVEILILPLGLNEHFLTPHI